MTRYVLKYRVCLDTSFLSQLVKDVHAAVHHMCVSQSWYTTPAVGIFTPLILADAIVDEPALMVEMC